MTPEELNQLAADDPGIVGLYDQVCAEARDMDPLRARAAALVFQHCQPTRNPHLWQLRSPGGAVQIPVNEVIALIDNIAARLPSTEPSETPQEM